MASTRETDTSPAQSTSWMNSPDGHPKRWAILSVLLVSLMVVVLDNTVLNIALPTIQSDLNASPSQLVWAVDSYILVFAALLFTWGVLGDRWGRRKVLIIGLVIFASASAAAAFSANAESLIVFRGIMGIGGAAVLPATLATITVVFPPHERGKAIGVWAGAVGAAVALGPVIGGVLLQHPDWTNWLIGNNWGSVFLINVPIVIIGVIAIIKVVPETRNPHPRALDIQGLLLSISGLGLLIYGIIHASETRVFFTASVLLPVFAGIGIIALFLILEARSSHASFDVALFKNRGYAVSLVAISLSFFALSGITFTLPFYLQIIRGYDTLTAGLFFVPFAVGQLLAAPRSAAMVAKFGYRVVMTFGLTLVALVLLVLAQIDGDTPAWLLLVAFFFFGMGMGNVIAPASTVMQNILPLERVGAGSAVQNTVRQVGGALGVAVIGTVLATSFANNLAPVLNKLPLEFRPDGAEEASESIISAVALIGQAKAAGAPANVIEQARSGIFEAFTSASHITSWISFAIVLIAALVVGFMLPAITPPTRRVLDETPSDPTDALIAEQAREYPVEAAEEIVAPPERTEK